MINKKLVIFNLATDEENEILAFSISWVREFAKIYRNVWVFSTHVGKYELPANVVVTEIGGGSTKNRIIALFRIVNTYFGILRNRKQISIFHHMSTKTAAILGLPIRLFGIKQILWYSHSAYKLDLKLSKIFVNYIVSSSPISLPFKSSKNRFLGHGIDVQAFQRYLNVKKEEDIISLGRVARIKKLDNIIEKVAQLKRINTRIDFIGPIHDDEYRKELEKLAKDKRISIRFYGRINYIDVPSILSRYKYLYTGNPKTIDKAAIEGALTGTFVLSEDKEVLHLCGILDHWEELQQNEFPNISEQISFLDKLDKKTTNRMRREISRRSAIRNNLSNTIQEISNLLENESE